MNRRDLSNAVGVMITNARSVVDKLKEEGVDISVAQLLDACALADVKLLTDHTETSKWAVLLRPLRDGTDRQGVQMRVDEWFDRLDEHLTSEKRRWIEEVWRSQRDGI